MAKDDKKTEILGGSDTGHKQEPAPVNAGGGSNPDGAMPMGMAGARTETTAAWPPAGDPDQKSTHNVPNTVESNLADGSPKFRDRKEADASRERARKARSYGGTFRVKSPIKIAIGDPDSETKRKPSRQYEVGDVVELSALDAESLAAHIEQID